MNLEMYIIQYNEENGLFLLSGVPEELIEEMKQQFKFRIGYKLKNKTVYYVKTEGSQTILREWR